MKRDGIFLNQRLSLIHCFQDVEMILLQSILYIRKISLNFENCTCPIGDIDNTDTASLSVEFILAPHTLSSSVHVIEVHNKFTHWFDI